MTAIITYLDDWWSRIVDLGGNIDILDGADLDLLLDLAHADVLGLHVPLGTLAVRVVPECEDGAHGGQQEGVVVTQAHCHYGVASGSGPRYRSRDPSKQRKDIKNM